MPLAHTPMPRILRYVLYVVCTHFSIGRLPLCLNIVSSCVVRAHKRRGVPHEPNAHPCLLAVHTMQAARMIGDSGEGWEDDVVPSMRAGMSQFMADATETAGGRAFKTASS